MSSNTFNLKNISLILLTDLSKNNTQIRCFCNQPDCVPQGYMCRGETCFTKLPSSANILRLKMESVYSGCLTDSLENRQCPAGFLCCNQNLCNHVDDPAMKNRFNQTIEGSMIVLFMLHAIKNILNISISTVYRICVILDN